MVRGGSGVKVAAIGYGTRRMKWRAGAESRLAVDTEEERIDNSLVVLRRRGNIVEKRTGGRAAPTTVNSLVLSENFIRLGSRIVD